MVLYTGIFFNKEQIESAITLSGVSTLEKRIGFPHVTFEFKPKTIDKELFGKEVDVLITGHANDGKNEGFSVEVVSDDEKIRKAMQEVKVPHITVSTSKDGKPVDTGKLNFEPLGWKIWLKGITGAFTTNGLITKEPQ